MSENDFKYLNFDNVVLDFLEAKSPNIRDGLK